MATATKAQKAAKAKAEALYLAKVEQLDKTYTLWYRQSDDELNVEQIQMLLSGDLEALEESFESWIFECRYDAAMAEIRGWPGCSPFDRNDRLCTDEEVEILRDHDLLDELRFRIEERDDSDPLTDLTRATPDVLVRYYLDVDVDGEDGTDEMSIIADAVGIDLDEELRQTLDAINAGEEPTAPANDAAIANMLANSEGGGVFIYWSVDLSQILKAVQGMMWRGEKWQITWTNPYLLIYNSWNGSGDAERVKVIYTADLKLERLHLDSGRNVAGYSDVCGGLYPSGFECKVELSQVEEEEA